MISWIQKTFQHHFRTFFAVMLGVIIISFVFVSNASSGLGRADFQARHQPFFDIDLGVKADAERLFRDANMSLELNPENAQFSRDIQQFALTRYAQIALANQLHVPAPTTSEKVAYIQKLRMFSGVDGQFDAKRYDDFLKKVRTENRNAEQEIAQVLADDIRAERVRKLLAGPGYVLPFDVKKEIERGDTSWTVGLASIDRASFTPAIATAEADLAKFFDENAFRYAIPALVTVSYAEFPATAFIGSVKVSEAEIRAYYDANPARFPKPADKTPASIALPATPNTEADYVLVRPQVELSLRLERANRLAAQAASALSLSVYERKFAAGSPELAAFLADRKVALKDAPPFSAEEVPAQLGGNPQIAEEAFKLSKERYFSDPVGTDNGVVVLFWKASEASRPSVLAEVRAKVTADFVETEKRRRFADLGRTLRTQVQTRLKAGDSFEKAVTAAATTAGVKVEVKTLPAFTLRQPPQDLEQSVFSTLEGLKQGEVSEMAAGSTKGFLLFAQEKKVPALDESNPQYVATRTRIAEMNANFSVFGQLNTLVQDELAKSAPKNEVATP